MTILVTGGAGLIGTRVVRKLLTEGDEVIHQDIRPPAREFNEGPGKLHVIVNDASQSEELLSIITTYNVERVIHLAAVLPLDSERHPHRTSLINVAGTTSLFEACLWTSRVKRIVYASSSSVYGPQSFYGERPVTEDDPLMPQMVYSAGRCAPSWRRIATLMTMAWISGGFVPRRFSVMAAALVLRDSWAHSSPNRLLVAQ